MKLRYKIIISVTSVLLFLNLTILAFRFSSSFQAYALNKSVKYIHSYINGYISFTEFKGNLFNSFTLSGISLKDSMQNPVLSIETLSIDWNFKPIFEKNIELNFIEISGVLFNLNETDVIHNDSTHEKTYNINTIFKKRDSKNNKKESGSDFNFILKKLVLNDINVISDLIFMTHNINEDYTHTLNINQIEAMFSFKDNILISRLNLDSLNIFNPDFELENLLYDIKMKNNILTINDLSIFTNKSIFSLSGDFNTKELINSKLSLEINPLNLSDFASFIPISIYEENLNLNTDIRIFDNSIKINIHLAENNTKINALANIFFSNGFKNLPEEYFLEASLLNIEPFKYIGDDNVNDVSFNSSLKVQGRGLNLNELNVKGEMSFYDLKYQDIKIDSLTLHTGFNDLKLSSDISILYKSDSKHNSKISGNIMIEDFLDTQKYYADFRLQNLDLSIINSDYNTNINSTLSISGKGFDVNQAFAKVNLISSESYYKDLLIDDLVLKAEIREDKLFVDMFSLDTDYLNVSLKSIIDKDSLYSSDVRIHIKDFLTLSETIELFDDETFIDFNGIIFIKAKGKLDDITGTAIINFKELVFNQIKVDNLDVYLNLNSIKDYDFISNLKIDNISYQNENTYDFINHISLNTVAANEKANIKLNIDRNNNQSFSIIDYFNLESQMDLNYDKDFKNVKMDITKLKISNPYNDWYSKSDIRLSIQNTEEFNLNNFNLNSRQQSIVIKDFLFHNNDTNIAFSLNNIIINDFLRHTLDNDELQIDGILNVDSQVSLKDMNISEINQNKDSYINIELEDLTYQNIPLGDLTIKTGYSDNVFISANAYNNNFNPPFKAAITASLPLTDTNLSKINLSQSDSISINLRIDELSLDKFNKFFPKDNYFNSLIDLSLNLSGSLEEPVFDGAVNLSNGEYKNTKYGVNFRNISLNMILQDNMINLDNFSFRGDRGSFNAKGYLRPEYRNNDLYVNDIDMQINLNNLQVMNSKLSRATLSSNIRVSGEENNVINVRGSLSSSDIRIYLDEILKMNNIKSVPEPLLVGLKNKNRPDIETDKSSDTDKEDVQTQNKGINFVKPSLKGNVRVFFPRNIWIQGKDVSIELTGDLLLEFSENGQTDDFIIVNGQIEINRGFYQFLGKRFYFEEGLASFIGNEPNNPEINLKANYFFRNPYGIRQKITLNISGKAQSPVISFTLDGISIDEKEAISLIVFGRGSELLTQNEEQAVVQNTGELQTATALLAGQLSGQLSQLLQRQLNLDMIEISGDNQWQQASLTVGRYFGSNLFVSYEKGFDFSDFKALKTDRVNIEYQINRYLFLNTIQGAGKDNGLDLLFKIQSQN